MPHPQYVKTGEKIHVRPFVDEEIEVEVNPPCEGRNGHWYCVTCQVGFAHNLASNDHYENGGADHLYAWICANHGPEPPA